MIDSHNYEEDQLIEDKVIHAVPSNEHKFMTTNTEMSDNNNNDLKYPEDLMIKNTKTDDSNIIKAHKPSVIEETYRDRFDTNEKLLTENLGVTYPNQSFEIVNASSNSKNNNNSPSFMKGRESLLKLLEKNDQNKKKRKGSDLLLHDEDVSIGDDKPMAKSTKKIAEPKEKESTIGNIVKNKMLNLHNHTTNLATNMMLTRARNKFKKLMSLQLSPKALELLDDFTILHKKEKEGYVDIIKSFSVVNMQERETWKAWFLKSRPGKFLKKKCPKFFAPKKKLNMRNNEIQFDDETKNWKNILKKPFSPFSKFRILWDSFLMIFLLITMILLPMELSFGLLEGNLAFEYCNLIIFSIDILLNFHTAYLHHGEHIFSHRKIARNYIKSWFFIDLLSTFPFGSMSEYFFNNSNTPDSAQFLKLFRVFRLLKVLRALRFFKMSNAFKVLREMAKISDGPVRLIKLLFTVVMLAHWLACIWHLVAYYETDFDFHGTWLHEQGIYDAEMSVRYIKSIYWALTTMLTVGYGDIVPVTVTETWFVIFAELFGCGVFAYALNTIGNVASQISSERSSLKKRIEFISDFFQRNKMNTEIHYKIKSYLEYLVEDGFSQHQDQELFLSYIPDHMRNEILIDINSKIFLQTPFFNLNFTKPFLCTLSYKLKEKVAGPEEIIFLESDPDSSVYFITRGRIQLFLEKNRKELKVLTANEYFGEVRFMTGKSRRASAKSLNFSTLFYLQRESFLEVLEKSPDEKESYCYIKDKVNIYNDYSVMSLKCFGCDKPGHVLVECPDSNIYPTPHEIFKQINILDKRFRKNFKRHERPKYPTLKKLKYTQETVIKFVIERKNMLDVYTTYFSQSLVDNLFSEKNSEPSNSEESIVSNYIFLDSDQDQAINEFKDDGNTESLLYLGDTFDNSKISRDVSLKKTRYLREIKNFCFDKVENFMYYFPHNNITNIIPKIEKMIEEKHRQEQIVMEATRRKSLADLKTQTLKGVTAHNVREIKRVRSAEDIIQKLHETDKYVKSQNLDFHMNHDHLNDDDTPESN